MNYFKISLVVCVLLICPYSAFAGITQPTSPHRISNQILSTIDAGGHMYSSEDSVTCPCVQNDSQTREFGGVEINLNRDCFCPQDSQEEDRIIQNRRTASILLDTVLLSLFIGGGVVIVKCRKY